MVSLLFKTALAMMLAPIAAAAEGPALAVAWERGAPEVARLRAENAARGVRGLSIAGTYAVREVSPVSLALGARARSADLVLVVETSRIRMLDVARRAFLGTQLGAGASVGELRRLVAQVARRWHAARPAAPKRTWLAYVVAGAAAAAFVAFVAIRVAGDDEPEPGLTLRFVSP